MGTVEKSLDLRVRRTRQLLKQAFLDLIAQKSFHAITVQDLTERAMVNRSTFYAHFPDKYALMECTVSEWFRDELASKLPDADHYRPESLKVLTIAMCEFFVGILGHCKVTNQQNSTLMESQVMKLVKEVLTRWLRDIAGKETAHSDAGELAVAVAAWVIYGSAQYWTEGKRKGSIPEFAEQVFPTIEGTLKAHL